MKISFALLASAGLAAAVSIIEFTPECSHKCFQDAVAGGSDCAWEDAACQCEVDNYRAIYDAGVTCVLTECGAAVGVNEVLPGAAAFCEAAIGPAATQVPDPTESGAQTSAPASESTPASSDAPATSSPAASAAPTAGGNSTATPPASSAPPSGTQSGSPPDSTGAASTIGAGILAIGGALVAFAL